MDAMPDGGLAQINRSDQAAAVARASEGLAEAMLEASALGRQRQLQAEQKAKQAEFAD